MKRTKFYVCPHCGSFMQGTENSQVVCCGKQIEGLKAVLADDERTIRILEIEDDFYIEFNHEMTKKLSFAALLLREQLNTIYVKHALLAAKKMHDEGDCISDDGITIVF